VRLRPGSEWTIGTFKVLMDERQAAQAALDEERDRRYAEVALEREKALKIKEQADRDALALDRDQQTYKDERANNLRTQLERERGDYATKDDLASLADKLESTIRPALEYIASAQGRGQGANAVWGYMIAIIGLGLAIAAFATR
jgi:hypothetical protein